MAIIKIIGDTIADATHEAQAVATAETWLKRIEELFITERSKQIQIGISEVGMDCRKCVARKLALTPRIIDGAWKPFIGTAVHDQLEHGFRDRWPDEYILEQRLHVHEYKDLKLSGSCDMAAVVETGNGVVVNDWKIVGKDVLSKARKGDVKNQYRIQAMLYGYGWEQLGYKVTHVALSFLPREEDLKDAVVVLVRYDKSIAIEALAQLESMIDAAEIVGWDAVIDKQPKASFCFSCKRYDQTDSMSIESMI